MIFIQICHNLALGRPIRTGATVQRAIHHIWQVADFHRVAPHRQRHNSIIQPLDSVVRQPNKHRRKISQIPPASVYRVSAEIRIIIIFTKIYIPVSKCLRKSYEISSPEKKNIFDTVLPDSTANDLDQHLSSLVGASPTGQMGGTHPSLTQTALNGTNAIHVPRYLATNNDYNLHTSNNGPRSLSDSSQAESPVQDDLLTSNTPNLGGAGGGGANGTNIGNGNNGNASSVVSGAHNFISVNQSQNAYGTSTGSGGGGGGGHGGGGGGCNSSSLYPVLPASLLYSQLYTAANQTHGFHSHSSQNAMVHGELQSVMEHISTASGRQQQNLMVGGTDLTHIGNCSSSARAGDESVIGRQMSGIQRAPHHTDNGNSVWRPY